MITNWWGITFIILVVALVYAILIYTAKEEQRKAQALKELRARQLNRRRG